MSTLIPTSSYYKAVQTHTRRNVCILPIGTNDPISPKEALKYLQNTQVKIEKRNSVI